MKIMTILAFAAASMTAVPALANPAASLSVAQSVDTAPATKSDRENGGVLVAILAAAAVVAGIVIVADNDDDSDSN